MAIQLPDFTALGQRPEAQLPRRTPMVASYRPQTGFEEAPSRELGRASNEMEGAAAMALKAQEQHDTLRAEAAYTALRQKQIDLSFGDQGFTKIKGGDAQNQPIMKDYGAQLDKTALDLSNGLDNEYQKKLFQSRAQVAGLQLREDIVRHISQQSDVYANDVFKSKIDTEIQAGASRWRAPDGASVPILNIDNAIYDYARRNGKPQEWVSDVQTKARSGLYTSMIKQAIADDPPSAMGLFEAHRKELTPEAQASLALEVKHAVLPMAAKMLADAIMAPQPGAPALTPVLGADPNAATAAENVQTGQSPSQQMRVGAYGPGGAPQAAKDTKAMLGEWLTRGEAEAQRLHPSDPIFRDMVVSQIKSRVATIIAAQEGIERQAHTFLLTSAAGINQDGSAREPVTSMADLLSDPQARTAWSNLDGQSQLAITTLIERNADRAAGKPSQVNARLEQQLLSRLYLPDSDPKKITRPEQITQFAGPGGLTIDGVNRLRGELGKMQNPEGRDFQHDINGARVHVLASMRNSIVGRIMNDTDPGAIDYAALRWYNALGDKIDAYRKESPPKDARSLIRADTPDSMMTPSVIQSFMPNARRATSDAARKNMPTVANDADYGALKSGTQYVAPDGSIRTKK